MRILVATGLLLASSSVHAERAATMWLGGSFAASGDANNKTNDDAHVWGGARLTLSFEDAPLEFPEPGTFITDTRLVPELLAGFLSDDERAVGYVGAGLRAELHFSRTNAVARPAHMRMAVYLAARGKIIGKQRDGGGELALGEYMIGPHDCRLGWELGLGMVKRSDVSADRGPEVDGLVNVYVGWR